MPTSALANPYPSAIRWFKGNLHTHTTASDGRHDPQEVVDWYAKRGYDFLVITDHNLVLPLDSLDPRGMRLIQGEELTHPRTHTVGIGLQQTLPCGESTQEQIDLINAAGGLAIVAHPNWMGLRVEDIAPLRGHIAIELSNQVCFRLNGLGDSVAWWDALLSQGHRCWGVAVDDMHDFALDAGFGWVLIALDGEAPMEGKAGASPLGAVAPSGGSPGGSPSESREGEALANPAEAAIRAALQSGQFVASTGPAFEQITVRGRTISVRTSPCRQIRFIGRGARVLHCVESEVKNEASYELPTDEPFVRVEIEDAAGHRAWTQPFWSIEE